MYNIIILNSKKKSLNLLKEYALKAALRVLTLVDQKLIRKNEVNPISSQPKNIVIVLAEVTSKFILKIKDTKNKINLSTEGSYLKYEKAYITAKIPIVIVKNTKLIEIKT